MRLSLRLAFGALCVVAMVALSRSSAQPPPPPPVTVNTTTILSPDANAKVKGANGIDVQASYENVNLTDEWLKCEITDVTGNPPFPAPLVMWECIPAQSSGSGWFPNTGALPAGTYNIRVHISDGAGAGFAHAITVTVT